MAAKKKSKVRSKLVAREGVLESVSKLEFVYFKYMSLIVIFMVASALLILSGYYYIGLPVLLFLLITPWIAEWIEERK